MTTETTETQTTSDGDGENTGESNDTGAVTHTEQTEAQTEKTFTQSEVDAMFQKRLKTAVKSELKKAIGENSDAPTVEELQRQLLEANTKTRSFETRDAVQNYFNDAKNKISVKAVDLQGAIDAVEKFLEYDDDGNISNLNEAVRKAKERSSSLFAPTPTASVNAGFGRGKTATVPNMNDLIHSAFARK